MLESTTHIAILWYDENFTRVFTVHKHYIVTFIYKFTLFNNSSKTFTTQVFCI